MKKLLIPILIAVVGFIFVISFSFFNGTRKFNAACNKIKVMTEDEIWENDLVGFDDCENGTLTVEPILTGSLVVTFVFQTSLLLTDINPTMKRRLIYLLATILLFLTFMGVEQMLLNTLPSISVKGWQDSGLTVSSQSNLMAELKDLNQRPTPFFVTIITIVLFSLTSSFGVFLAGFVDTWLKKKQNIWIRVSTFLFISFIIQIVIYIVTFPLTIFMSLSYM